MTRKRFVKLLMAKGYDRNEANATAEYARMSGRSYAEAYKVHPASVSNLMDIIGPALHNFGVQLEKMANALSKAVAAFGEAYKDAMEED